MKLEEIQTIWRNDSNIDRTELGEESLRIPQLHSKYYNMFSAERMQLRKLEQDYFQLKILKTDLSIYMQSDTHLKNLSLKIAVQKEKVEFLESVIKNLPARGYQINAAITWEKFKVGA